MSFLDHETRAALGPQPTPSPAFSGLLDAREAQTFSKSTGDQAEGTTWEPAREVGHFFMGLMGFKWDFLMILKYLIEIGWV